MPSTKQQIYIALSTGGQPVPVGVITFQDDGVGKPTHSTSLTYLPSYDGPPLDPVNLDFRAAGTRHFRLPDSLKSSGLFRVFGDGLPGSWGRRILATTEPATEQMNDAQLLAHLCEHGRTVGAMLMFTRRPGDERPLTSLQQVEDTRVTSLKDLAAMASSLTDHQKQASLVHGGARPKTTFHDVDGEVGARGVHYIVKFNEKIDAFNSARVEHATMMMARLAGIGAARTKVVRVMRGGSVIGDMYLTERYDRYLDKTGVERRCHKISMLALTDPSKVAAQDKGDYVHAFEVVRAASSSPDEDCVMLFRRMLFNIGVNNTDDHLKNHEMLVSMGPNGKHECRLAPAFDLLPVAHPYPHTTKIAGHGNGVLNDEFVTMMADKAGIDRAQALTMRNEVVGALSKWESVLTTAKCDERDQGFFMKALSISGTAALKAGLQAPGSRNPMSEMMAGTWKPSAPSVPNPAAKPV